MESAEPSDVVDARRTRLRSRELERRVTVRSAGQAVIDIEQGNPVLRSARPWCDRHGDISEYVRVISNGGAAPLLPRPIRGTAASRPAVRRGTPRGTLGLAVAVVEVCYSWIRVGPANVRCRGSKMNSREYDIRLEDKYGGLTLIDIPAEIAAHEPWFNQTLTTVNNSVVRLGVLEGNFHWHKHDEQDEFFLVLEGQLLIDLEGRDTVVLDPHQGYTVPRGVLHRTRAARRTAVLMVEAAGVVPTGD